VKRRHTNTVLK